MTQAEFLNKVIRTRNKLIKMKASGKNAMKCASITKRLQTYIDAYGNKYSAEQWRSFIQRNYDDIVFIIPGNNSYEHNLQTLNSFLL
jgi:hypothetical protein